MKMGTVAAGISALSLFCSSPLSADPIDRPVSGVASKPTPLGPASKFASPKGLGRPAHGAASRLASPKRVDGSSSQVVSKPAPLGSSAQAASESMIRIEAPLDNPELRPVGDPHGDIFATWPTKEWARICDHLSSNPWERLMRFTTLSALDREILERKFKISVELEEILRLNAVLEKKLEILHKMQDEGKSQDEAKYMAASKAVDDAYVALYKQSIKDTSGAKPELAKLLQILANSPFKQRAIQALGLPEICNWLLTLL